VAKGSPQARTRRRFARRQWARRWLTWRYLLAGFLLVGAIGFTVYAVYFSPWLRVEGADVVGTAQLTEAEVLDAADVPEGGALARVDLDAIADRVEDLAAVKSADVTRQWPHEVRIEVVERTPVAVVASSAGFTQLDEDGHPFGRLPKAPPGLPLVEIGAGAEPDARVEGARVVASLPDEVVALLDHVEVESVDRILLELRDGRVVRWGSADQSDEKAEVLLTLLKQKAQEYDVSVPGMPTVR
jgi:cell division protein FtsQ